MDFGFTPEQQDLLDAVSRFMVKEVAPHVADYDREERFPLELVRHAGKLGFLGGVIPPEFGGSGMDYQTLALLVEEMSKTCHIMGLCASVASGLVGSALLAYGTEEQKKEFLAPLARGEQLAGAAVTEPASGTDVASMQTIVRRDGSDYIIHGNKTWISFLDVGAWFLTFAVLRVGGDGAGRYCAFVVPRDTPGLQLRPFSNKLGFRPLATGEFVLDEVRVPRDMLVGEEGDGLRIAMHAVESGRLGVAARACGLAAASLGAASTYALERVVMGHPIGQFQLVQSMLTDIIQGLEGARLLTLKLAWMKDHGLPDTRMMASLAKMTASDVAMKAATYAVQIHGANGVSDEFPVARHFRDAKVFQIIEGNNQLHQSLVSEFHLGLRTDRPLSRKGEVLPEEVVPVTGA